jgi:DNA-directed RNA polymerase specialized sigma24 family protein
MSDIGHNHSAEVVAGRSRESRQAVACMEKCLKVLPPEQRDLLLKYYGVENQLPADLALSVLQLKTGTRELRECLRKCLEQAEDN